MSGQIVLKYIDHIHAPTGINLFNSNYHIPLPLAPPSEQT